MLMYDSLTVVAGAGAASPLWSSHDPGSFVRARDDLGFAKARAPALVPCARQHAQVRVCRRMGSWICVLGSGASLKRTFVHLSQLNLSFRPTRASVRANVAVPWDSTIPEQAEHREVHSRFGSSDFGSSRRPCREAVLHVAHQVATPPGRDGARQPPRARRGDRQHGRRPCAARRGRRSRPRRSAPCTTNPHLNLTIAPMISAVSVRSASVSLPRARFALWWEAHMVGERRSPSFCPCVLKAHHAMEWCARRRTLHGSAASAGRAGTRATMHFGGMPQCRRKDRIARLPAAPRGCRACVISMSGSIDGHTVSNAPDLF